MKPAFHPNLTPGFKDVEWESFACVQGSREKASFGTGFSMPLFASLNPLLDHIAAPTDFEKNDRFVTRVQGASWAACRVGDDTDRGTPARWPCECRSANGDRWRAAEEAKGSPPPRCALRRASSGSKWSLY